MENKSIRPELFATVTQGEDTGKLTVNVTSERDNRPIEGASVRITYDGQPDNIIEETTTNPEGQIPDVELNELNCMSSLTTPCGGTIHQRSQRTRSNPSTNLERSF